MSLSLLIVTCLIPTFALGSSSPKKRSKSDRDISAIGHRKIAYEAASRVSLENEQKWGEQFSITFEQSTKFLFDPAIADYIERVSHSVATNSDSRIPVTVRIIDSEEVNASVLPGGHVYLTRGLLLQLGDEGEVASVLARAIAHTALRSGVNLLITARIGSASAIFGPRTGSAPIFREGQTELEADMLRIKREEEFDADYFGIQYLYKSGYDPECFVSFVRKVWPADASITPGAMTISAFPPVPERLEALQKETRDILPKRDGAVTNTPEFADFHKRLEKLSYSASENTAAPKAVPDHPSATAQFPEVPSQQVSSAAQPAVEPSATDRAAEPAEVESSPCANIDSTNPQFALLAKTCDFVVSPKNLPNFICQETVKRFHGDSRRERWKNLDVVITEVRFDSATGTDRYFNVTVDGRPLKGKSGPDLSSSYLSGKDLGEYLAIYYPGGMWGYGEFGVTLSHLFAPSSRTSFKIRDGGDPAMPSAAVFDFGIERANSKFILNAGQLHTRSGLDGSLWVDSASSKLRRADFNSKEVESTFPIKDFSSRTDFGDVTIAGAGQFLLPVASETIECQRTTNRCQRNVLEFHDCRKYGSESRIILK